MVNFGPLAAEIGLPVWGTPGNFNGFLVLAALLPGTLVVGVSQTAALNRRRHLYSAGRPSRWAVAHILVLSVTVEALQGKMCQNSLPSVGEVTCSQDFRGSCHPWGIFVGFYKTRYIFLSNSGNCTVLRAVVLTQCRRVTDGQTDEIAIASTALAMRALRRAVKTH